MKIFLCLLLLTASLEFVRSLPLYPNILIKEWLRQIHGKEEFTKVNQNKISMDNQNLFLKKDTSLGDEVKFYLYTASNTDTYQELVYNNESTISSSNIDFYNPTTIIVHGYFDSISSDIIQLIKNTLLAREKHNVIGVDWSAIADTIIYSNAADSVPDVGQYLSQFIQFLISNGQSLSYLHLIGHSLGAHVVGLAGLNFFLTTQDKIPRITGLDPAKPGFESADATQRLDITDADFVDCIHTCSGELGLGKPVCSADYYPNGASSFQPGCSVLDIAGVCSHGRSYEYYAESIILSHKFNAMQCQTVPQDSTASNCAKSGALMGDPATSEFKGLYLVVTNSEFPYSQDIVNSKSE